VTHIINTDHPVCPRAFIWLATFLAWTSTTLLAREMAAAEKAQAADGEQRLFIIDANQVGQEVPEYLNYVQSEVHKLGRNHPFVKTQYFSEMIDAEGGMFPPERQAIMCGTHDPWPAPPSAQVESVTRLTSNSQPPIANPQFAFLIDVAGEDEAATTDLSEDRADLMNKARDSHALTIVEIDLSTLEDDLIQAPRYLVRHRKLWTGTRHTALYAQLKALAELWDPRYIVIDATGVGAGLASFLEAAFGEVVIPFLFTSSSKSKLGWDFLAVIETGRYKDFRDMKTDALQSLFWQQVSHTQMDISLGPNRSMKWGVPDGTREIESGDLIHDDLVISAALCSVLDQCEWGRGDSTEQKFE
jgi:hypothetical protein